MINAFIRTGMLAAVMWIPPGMTATTRARSTHHLKVRMLADGLSYNHNIFLTSAIFSLKICRENLARIAGHGEGVAMVQYPAWI
jgi:hypothetical protein